MHKAFKWALAILVGGATLGGAYYLIDTKRLNTSADRILWVIPDTENEKFHLHDLTIGMLLFVMGGLGAGAVYFLAKKAGVETVANAAAAGVPKV